MKINNELQKGVCLDALVAASHMSSDERARYQGVFEHECFDLRYEGSDFPSRMPRERRHELHFGVVRWV